MPTATNGTVSIRYTIEAAAPESAADPDEAIVFCGDIGLGPWQFGWQHAALAGRYPVVIPETRGVGGSDTPPGPYTIDQLAADLDAVCTAVGRRNVHLVGYGLGGMVALQYALAATRPASLTVIGAPAAGDRYNPDGVWADPNLPSAVEGSLTGLLSASFRERHPDALAPIVQWRCTEDANQAAFSAQKAAIDSFDITDRLYELTTPTLVIHGTDDTVCPPVSATELADGLPRGERRAIDGARHFVGIEASAAVNDAVTAWLAEHAGTPLSA